MHYGALKQCDQKFLFSSPIHTPEGWMGANSESPLTSLVHKNPPPGKGHNTSSVTINI